MNSRLVRLPIAVEGGQIQREGVLAEPTTETNCYRVKSIPAFAYGLAYGDTICVPEPETGRFDVTERGGQITMRVFVNGSLDRHAVRDLLERVNTLQGKYEIGNNDSNQYGTSLLLLSLDIRQGFDRIESLMYGIESTDIQWEYGNVYDEYGHPLNWWM